MDLENKPLLKHLNALLYGSEFLFKNNSVFVAKKKKNRVHSGSSQSLSLAVYMTSMGKKNNLLFAISREPFHSHLSASENT